MKIRSIAPAALLALGLFLAAPAHAAVPDACAAMVPFGSPVTTSAEAPQPRLLCRRGYLAAHDDARREPAWVAERLTAASAWGCNARADAFKPDPALPQGVRAETADYLHSGYDMGHMASAANHMGDVIEQAETFYLSNMTPQLHTLNAGLWFKLEVMGRVWAHQRGPIQVLSGPVHQVGQPTIGAHALPVPVAFWKVFVDLQTRETLAFLVPHGTYGWKDDPAQFVVSLARIEAATGLTLPRPGGSVLLEPTAPWPVQLGLADDLKAASCPTPAHSSPSLPGG